LNLTIPEDARSIVKPWDEREDDSKFAESGVDDQIIIQVPFVQSVRIRSILLRLGRGELAPNHLRVYANHTSIVDFSDAQTIKPQMNISLLDGQTGVTEYPVRAATFSSVNSVSLFFSDAQGGETTRLYYLGFKGEARGALREAGTRLDIKAQNAPDATIVDKAAEQATRHTTIR